MNEMRVWEPPYNIKMVGFFKHPIMLHIYDLEDAGGDAVYNSIWAHYEKELSGS